MAMTAAASVQGLDGLTAAQREAVLAEDQVLAVIAGAGSGKTGVLTARVARRCQDRTAEAGRSVVCTFSRKAADELRMRLWRLGVTGVRSGTVHRLALRLVVDWREHRSDAPPVVLGDRRRLLEGSLGPDARSMTAALLDTEIGWAKARLVAPESYEVAVRATHRVLRAPAGLVAEGFAAYEAERRRRGLLDLDDLLLEAATAIEVDDSFGTAQRWQRRHVFVDEVQDLSPAQFRLLCAVVGDEPDLFVVGDPSQSVYGWNGADPGLIEDLGLRFPSLRVIGLEENHRCAPAIVRLATAALGATGRPIRSTRPEASLPILSGHADEEAEARWVARQAWLAHRPGRRWSHIAVLARTNLQLEAVARALDEQRIPVERAAADRGPASDLGRTSREGTLDDHDDDRGDAAVDGVVLSTFHRAKGLQWPCVFVIGLTEGLVPVASARSQEALAEERRLLYVAMTRAEDELWCSWAAGRGQRPSRWWADIERAREDLEHEQAPSPPAIAAEHLARLRALVTGRSPSDD